MKKQMIMILAMIVGSLHIVGMDSKNRKKLEKEMRSVLERCAAHQGVPVHCPALVVHGEPNEQYRKHIETLDRVKTKYFPNIAISVQNNGDVISVSDADYVRINNEMIASGTYHHYTDDNRLVASLQSGVQSDYITSPGKEKVAVSKGTVDVSTFQQMHKKQAIDAFLAMMSKAK
jgi:hypothetical protein